MARVVPPEVFICLRVVHSIHRNYRSTSTCPGFVGNVGKLWARPVLGKKNTPTSACLSRIRGSWEWTQRDSTPHGLPPRANSARGPSPTGPHYGFSYPAKFTNKNGPSLGPLLLVDAGGLSPNTWERIERLSSMWEQAKQGVGSERPRAGEPNFGMVFNPTRRSRTPLTENEVGAIRAAREAGETVTSIARRFEVHRLTVWERTRDLPVSK